MNTINKTPDPTIADVQYNQLDCHMYLDRAVEYLQCSKTAKLRQQRERSLVPTLEPYKTFLLPDLIHG